MERPERNLECLVYCSTICKSTFQSVLTIITVCAYINLPISSASCSLERLNLSMGYSSCSSKITNGLLLSYFYAASRGAF